MSKYLFSLTITSLLICLVTPSLCASYVLDKGPKPAATAINFNVVQGLILVEAVVEGKKGHFLLDSGAPSLILNQKPRSHDDTFVMTDCELAAEHIKNLPVQIGSYQTTVKHSWSIDLSQIEQNLGFRFDGLIGIDVFHNQELLIDFAHHEMFIIEEGQDYPLEKWASKVVRIPFSNHNKNLPILKANYKGKSLNLAFDTGANRSVLSDDIKWTNDPSELSKVDFGALKIEAIPFKSLELDRLNENNSKQLDGIISASAFNAEQIFISFRRKHIYFFYNQDIVSN